MGTGGLRSPHLAAQSTPHNSSKKLSHIYKYLFKLAPSKINTTSGKILEKQLRGLGSLTNKK